MCPRENNYDNCSISIICLQLQCKSHDLIYVDDPATHFIKGPPCMASDRAPIISMYLVTVFAYGATGAGKTFTMLGSESEPGVMFHTMRDLYQRIGELKPDKTCEVAVSYLEVCAW